MSEVTLHLGDCLEYMRTMPAGSVDAVVTDPPYGLGKKLRGGTWGNKYTNETMGWDLETSEEAIGKIIGMEVPSIIWGANYYIVPPSRCWLIWQKPKFPTMAEFEMAWTNIDTLPKIFYEPRVSNDRQHPTQKPLDLIKWCLEIAKLPAGATVFDPFMGSGTTGVACVQTGRNFIGCEISPEYFAIAQRRIAAAQMQPRLEGV